MGASVIANAAVALAQQPHPPIIEIHLLGAAIVQSDDWQELVGLTEGGLYNYYSREDYVLKNYFSPLVGTRWRYIVGLRGFGLHDSDIHDIDVTSVRGDKVGKDHNSYKSVVKLKGSAHSHR